MKIPSLSIHPMPMESQVTFLSQNINKIFLELSNKSTENRKFVWSFHAKHMYFHYNITKKQLSQTIAQSH